MAPVEHAPPSSRGSVKELCAAHHRCHCPWLSGAVVLGGSLFWGAHSLPQCAMREAGVRRSVARGSLEPPPFGASTGALMPNAFIRTRRS